MARRRALRNKLKTIGLASIILALAAGSVRIYLSTSQAATYAANAQAEAATLTGAATKVTNASASGGTAVAFGGASGCTRPSSTTMQDRYDSKAPPAPWKRYVNQKVTVYFQTSKLNAEYREYVNTGARNWSTTACVNAVSVATCPANAYCVDMYYVNLPNESWRASTGGYSSGGYATKKSIEINTAVLDGASTSQRRVTTVHEMGHAIGLPHRANPAVMMYGGGSKPTASVMPDSTDAFNLLVAYGPQQFSPSAGEAEAPEVIDETIIE